MLTVQVAIGIHQTPLWWGSCVLNFFLILQDKLTLSYKHGRFVLLQKQLNNNRSRTACILLSSTDSGILKSQWKALTTPIPSKANIAVPKNNGYFFQPTTGGSCRGSTISWRKQSTTVLCKAHQLFMQFWLIFYAIGKKTQYVLAVVYTLLYRVPGFPPKLSPLHKCIATFPPRHRHL